MREKELIGKTQITSICTISIGKAMKKIGLEKGGDVLIFIDDKKRIIIEKANI